MAELGNRLDRQHELPVSAPVTLDMDGTLSEVYSRLKELASFNHEGRRGFLSVFVARDERRRILAADLLKGSASEKPGAAGLLRRALQALPASRGPVSSRRFEAARTGRDGAILQASRWGCLYLTDDDGGATGLS